MFEEKDTDAIEEICSLTWKTVYRFIYFKVQNRQEAEDITQETYVRTLSYLKRHNAKVEEYTGFLKTTALNILRDRWRKKKRWALDVSLEAVNPKETAVDDDMEVYTQRAIVQEALNRLNEEQRTVIELRILKGYSTKETARIMEKKEGTIRVLQYRALKNLSAILENMGS
jgi:RNA polymerase sigma-70 factor (ECF subfamily)